MRNIVIRGENNSIVYHCKRNDPIFGFVFFLLFTEAPKLAHETFKAIKPGLSSYADDPDKVSNSI